MLPTSGCKDIGESDTDLLLFCKVNAGVILFLTVRPRAEFRRAASALDGVALDASVGKPRKSPGFRMTCCSLRPLNSDGKLGIAAWNEATCCADSDAAAGAAAGTAAAVAACKADLMAVRHPSVPKASRICLHLLPLGQL